MKFRCAQRLLKFIAPFLQGLIQGHWAMSLKTTRGNKPFSSIFHECRSKKQKETRHFYRFFMSFDQKCIRKRVIFSTNQRFSIIFPSFCGPPSSRSLYEPLQKGGIAKKTHKLITFASIYRVLFSTSSTFCKGRRSALPM